MIKVINVFPFAQGDPAESITPVLCAAIGFIIIPGAFYAWFLFLRQKPRGVGITTSTLVASIVLILWIIGWVGLHYDPSIDDGAALMAVEELREVQQFVKGEASSLPVSGKEFQREANVNVGEGEDAETTATNEWTVTVGEFEHGLNKPVFVWNVFRVNAVTGEILVRADRAGNVWMPLATWRALKKQMQHLSLAPTNTGMQDKNDLCWVLPVRSPAECKTCCPSLNVSTWIS